MNQKSKKIAKKRYRSASRSLIVKLLGHHSSQIRDHQIHPSPVLDQQSAHNVIHAKVKSLNRIDISSNPTGSMFVNDSNKRLQIHKGPIIKNESIHSMVLKSMKSKRKIKADDEKKDLESSSTEQLRITPISVTIQDQNTTEEFQKTENDLNTIHKHSSRANTAKKINEDSDQKEKRRRKRIPWPLLCTFLVLLGLALVASILAAVLISLLYPSNSATESTLMTANNFTTTTVTTTTTTTETTTTATITYLPTGIYALQIPSCATWNTIGITVTGSTYGTPGNDTGSLDYPVSIFIDNNYTLYVADRDNERILKYDINATTGTVVAGTGSAGSGANQLNQPKGVAVDQMGAIIVADSQNYRIQRFPSGSTVGTTIASNSSTGILGQTRDLHIDVNNGIYVTDSDYSHIVKFYPNNGIGVVLVGNNGAGSAANQLLSPFGNFIDGNQSLYIADYGNHRIQMWSAGATSGITVAGITGTPGSGLANLNGPISVIVDNNGYTYIADYNNNRIVKWTNNYAAGGICIVGCTGTAGSLPTQLSGPRDLKFDASGNLYVSDQLNHRVQKFMIEIPPNCTVAG